TVATAADDLVLHPEHEPGVAILDDGAAPEFDRPAPDVLRDHVAVHARIDEGVGAGRGVRRRQQLARRAEPRGAFDLHADVARHRGLAVWAGDRPGRTGRRRRRPRGVDGAAGRQGDVIDDLAVRRPG